MAKRASCYSESTDRKARVVKSLSKKGTKSPLVVS